jgi:hypothetical protein
MQVKCDPYNTWLPYLTNFINYINNYDYRVNLYTGRIMILTVLNRTPLIIICPLR